MSARRVVGSTDGASWDLVVEPSGAPPLWTFPRAAWDRELYDEIIPISDEESIPTSTSLFSMA